MERISAERALNILASIISVGAFLYALWTSDWRFFDAPKMNIGSLSIRLTLLFALQGSFGWASGFMITTLCRHHNPFALIGVILICLVSAWQTTFFVNYIFFGNAVENGWQLSILCSFIYTSLLLDLFLLSALSAHAGLTNRVAMLQSVATRLPRSKAIRDGKEGGLKEELQLLGALEMVKLSVTYYKFANLFLVFCFMAMNIAILLEVNYLNMPTKFFAIAVGASFLFYMCVALLLLASFFSD